MQVESKMIYVRRKMLVKISNRRKKIFFIIKQQAPRKMTHTKWQGRSKQLNNDSIKLRSKETYNYREFKRLQLKDFSQKFIRFRVTITHIKNRKNMKFFNKWFSSTTTNKRCWKRNKKRSSSSENITSRKNKKSSRTFKKS